MVITSAGTGKHNGSAVSWSAVFAGSAAAAALSLILLILGSGLGLSVVSPWVGSGASATAIGLYAIVWIISSSLVAAGLGGYLAGRLRVKWTEVAEDEVFFRDTAHGFLSWAVSTLITAVLLTAVIGSMVSGAIQAGATVTGSAMTAAATSATAGAAVAGTKLADSFDESGVSIDYFVDSLFRKVAGTRAMSTEANDKVANDKKKEDTTSASVKETRSARIGSEIARIFVNSIQAGSLRSEDLRYVSEVIAEHTDLTQEQAQKRVEVTFARIQAELKEAEVAAREAADQARKASSYTALWIFISLLSSAFVASIAAIYGGRQRDVA